MKILANIENDNYEYNHLIHNCENDKHKEKHMHAIYEMLYIINGEGKYFIEDRCYNIKKHSLLIIKPCTYHYFSITSNTDYEKIGVLFNHNFFNVDVSSLDNLEMINCKDYPIIDEIFNKLDFYFSTFDKEVFLNLYSSLIKEIVLNLSLISNSAKPTYKTPILSPILEYINNNLNSIKNLDEVSKALGISTSYLKCIFKNELKIQPKRYINEKRLLYAKQLLLTGKKAINVCQTCGYNNYSTFWRAFCAYFGYPPSLNSLGNNKIK